MAGPIPTKKIPQLTALGVPLQGVEQLEIWVANTSRRITARDFVLPAIDPLITAVDFTSVLTASRYLTQGPGIQMTDGGPGQPFEIAMLGTGALPGDPTALVGLTAINGVATSWMRSDAAPALNQAIAPTWTGVHTFTRAGAFSTPTVWLSNVRPLQRFTETDAAADNGNWYIDVQSEAMRFAVINDAGNTSTFWCEVNRTGTTVDSIAFISTALTWNGAPIAGGVTGLANPTASVGLTAVNGVALTAMRSDAAPALSQAIAPSWSGVHTFTAGNSPNNPSLRLSSARPVLDWIETDAAADNGRWYFDAQAEALRFAARDDAGSSSSIFLQIERTGLTIDDIGFFARVSMPIPSITVTGAAQNVDLRLGNEFNLSLQSSTTITFTNPPANNRSYTFTLYLFQDATGSRTITWPASVRWSDGITPVLTTTANRMDAVTLTTYNGGTTYLGGQVLANVTP